MTNNEKQTFFCIPKIEEKIISTCFQTYTDLQLLSMQLLLKDMIYGDGKIRFNYTEKFSKNDLIELVLADIKGLTLLN